jgi:hypothetical protein
MTGLRLRYFSKRIPTLLSICFARLVPETRLVRITFHVIINDQGPFLLFSVLELIKVLTQFGGRVTHRCNLHDENEVYVQIAHEESASLGGNSSKTFVFN